MPNLDDLINHFQELAHDVRRVLEELEECDCPTNTQEKIAALLAAIQALDVEVEAVSPEPMES